MADGEEDVATYTVHYLDGHKEKTTWLERAGLAVVTYANGDRFEGRFSSHREREGRGKYTWAVKDEEGAPTGETAAYDGDYHRGRRHGVGLMRYPDGSTYEGQWADDLREGRGTLTYANGDTYTGVFRANKPHGHGAYQFASPKSYLLGQWADGEFIRGRWAKTDGSAYYGQFKDGQPINSGLFYNPSGLKQEARYEEHKDGDGEDEGSEDNTPLSRALAAGRIEESRAGPGHYSSIISDPLDAEDFVVCARKTVPADDEEEAASAQEVGPASETVEQECSSLQALFESVDVNHDGRVSVEELVAALSGPNAGAFENLVGVAPALADAALHEDVKNVDKDGDGLFSLEEFVDYFYAMKLFALVDADGSKQVRHGELQASLLAHADLFPPSLLASTSARPTSRIAISGFLSAADNDDDRLLSFEEFLFLLFKAPSAV